MQDRTTATTVSVVLNEGRVPDIKKADQTPQHLQVRWVAAGGPRSGTQIDSQHSLLLSPIPQWLPRLLEDTPGSRDGPSSLPLPTS